MRSQIVIGKQSYHQIMIELALRISFVLSMSGLTPAKLSTIWKHSSFHLFWHFFLNTLIKGMRRRDGFQRMGNQILLLGDEKTSYQLSGKDLMIEMFLHTLAILGLHLMKGRAFKQAALKKMLLLGELVFQYHRKLKNLYVELQIIVLIFFSLLSNVILFFYIESWIVSLLSDWAGVIV